jgi:prepilin-type N-terminal cleavage/methylation domain-containing protein
MPKSKFGFTLIELLVVIAILAILAVIGMVVFSGVQKNARDAKRKADVAAIAQAYEVKKSNTGGYAVLLDADFAGGKIPAPPEGASGGNNKSYFSVVDRVNGTGSKVCAALESNPSRVCNTPSTNCYCLPSIQGTLAPDTPISNLDGTNTSAGVGNPSSSSCDPNGTLNTGLVGYWKLDETTWSGNGAVKDLSGYNNNGTAINGAVIVPGKFGNAGQFDGNSAMIQVPDSTSLSMHGTDLITISAWVKRLGGSPNPATNPYPRVVNKEFWNHEQSGSGGYMINVDNANGYGQFMIKNANDMPGPTDWNLLSATQWEFLVGTYDGNTVTFYHNYTGGSGTKIQTPFTLGIGPNNNWPFYIGGSGSLNGLVDDVRIYNRALSDQEVQALYNNGNGCVNP